MAKTYNTFTNVATGDVYTASQHNAILTNLGNYRVPPMCVLTIGSGLGTGGVTGTSIGTFGNTTTTGTYTEEVDTDDMHSTSSNQTRITINTAGVYVVTGLINANGASDSSVNINKNGTSIAYQAVPTGPNFATQALTITTSLAVNDYLEFQASLITSRTVAVRFSAVWLGQVS